MTDFESRLATALRDEAEEFSMNIDVQHASETLDSRLDDVDQRRRRTVWLTAVASVAAVALVVVGVGLLRPSPPAPAPLAPTFDFTSTEFGLPFKANLPAWVTSYRASPNSEKPEWVTWNRCPDPATECIGLSFNRTGYLVQPSGNPEAVTYQSLLAHLDELANAGAIEMSARSTTIVGGRPATVVSILPKRTVPAGVGCHNDSTCEDFLEAVPGRYAVVDTASLDPDREVLVVWTRAGALDAAEVGWLTEFDRMLAGLQFSGASPAAG